MAKLPGATVLLLVVVPMCMYTCAFLIGVQLGRELERNPGRNQLLGVHLVRSTLVRWFPNSVDGTLVVTARGSSAGYATTNNKAAEKVAVSSTWQKPQNHFFISNVYDGDVVSRNGGGVRRSSSSSKQPYRATIPLPPVDHVPNTKSTTTATTASVTFPSTQQRYYNKNHTSPRGVISVGPWGGSGGQPFYMSGTSAPRLRSIVISHSGAVHSLACKYDLAGDYEGRGRTMVAGPWGHSYSYYSSTIELRSGEHITAMEGTTGHYGNVHNVVITSLTFHTSAGRTFGPYGSAAAGSHHFFSVPAADGACIAGFWGRSGRLLDAIGVYIRPCSYPKYTPGRQGRN